MGEMSYDHERSAAKKERHVDQGGGSAKQAHPAVGMLLQMQRTAGNAAVNALLSGRSGSGMAVQREAAEEEPLQAMGSAQYEAVQRHVHHIPPRKEGTNVWNTSEEE